MTIKPVKTLGLRPLWLISSYSKPVQRWRTESTPSAEALNNSRWMWDYWGARGAEGNLVEWLEHRLILGPPRPRGRREICDYDEDYMTPDEFRCHYVPWAKTWPEPDDHSWCKVRSVPDWAKEEFIQKKAAEAAKVSKIN
jgi:hypothetical protein